MRRYASAIVSRHCACRSIIHDLEVNNLTTPYALSPSLQVHGNPARTIDAPTRGNHAIAAKFMPFVFHDLLKNPQEKRRLAAPWSRFATAARSTGRSSTFHPDVRIKTRHYFAKGSEIFHWNIFDHATNLSRSGSILFFQHSVFVLFCPLNPRQAARQSGPRLIGPDEAQSSATMYCCVLPLLPYPSYVVQLISGVATSHGPLSSLKRRTEQSSAIESGKTF